MIAQPFRRHFAATLLCLVSPLQAFAQDQAFTQGQTLTQGLDISAISPPSLDAKTADVWAGLVLKGIDSEFPNKPSVVYQQRPL
jgi:hypothetical protein